MTKYRASNAHRGVGVLLLVSRINSVAIFPTLEACVRLRSRLCVRVAFFDIDIECMFVSFGVVCATTRVSQHRVHEGQQANTLLVVGGWWVGVLMDDGC